MRVVHSCPYGCATYTAQVRDRKFRKEVRIKVEDICPVCGSLMEQAIYPENDVDIKVFRRKLD